VAISFFMGLLRRSAPRNDKLLIAFVLDLQKFAFFILEFTIF